jgi:hypothetical protein
LFCYGEASAQHVVYTQIFDCNVGSFHFTYIGISMHHRKLMNKDWKHVEERFQKRPSGWRSKMLLVGGKFFLINLVLSSLPYDIFL